MRKILTALIFASAFIIPATAQAQLPPGYTQGTTFDDAALPYVMKDCAHCRAKLLRWHLQYGNNVIAKQNLKLAVGARDGHVFWHNRVDSRYDQPGTKPGDRWSANGVTIKSDGPCCGGGHYAHADSQWGFHGVITQFWTLDLQIQAHVGGPGRGPNDIWFSKWSRFQ